MINTPSVSLKGRKVFVFQHLSFYEQLKFHAQLSMKSFNTSRPPLSSTSEYDQEMLHSTIPDHSPAYGTKKKTLKHKDKLADKNKISKTNQLSTREYNQEVPQL